MEYRRQVDVSTGQERLIPMEGAEETEFKTVRQEPSSLMAAEVTRRQKAKEAVLAKLGITEEEAKELLR